MFQLVVNVLGTITVALCATLLLRAYFQVRSRLLLWSGLCFSGLTLSNFILLIDLWVIPNASFYTWRLAIAAISMLLLVYGLLFESD